MSSQYYYVPAHSHWPIVGSVALACIAVGAVNWIHAHEYGFFLFLVGICILVGMMFGWFTTVIHEAQRGLHNPLVDRSFRWGMVWFIFSEVMFFAAFFGALFYMRTYSVPWLGGLGQGAATHEFLWPNFQATWPLFKNPDPKLFVGPRHILSAWGIPALNTAILLTSALTLTWAHWALRQGKREQLVIGLLITVLLGVTFLGCQGYEYTLAYLHDGLTLGSGAYGSTFFMLTGFHGMHVTVGAIMLTTMLVRCLKGHFTADHHFAFEACAWYWHFVDVVWLVLFVFVYWL